MRACVLAWLSLSSPLLLLLLLLLLSSRGVVFVDVVACRCRRFSNALASEFSLSSPSSSSSSSSLLLLLSSSSSPSSSSPSLSSSSLSVPACLLLPACLPACLPRCLAACVRALGRRGYSYRNVNLVEPLFIECRKIHRNLAEARRGAVARVLSRSLDASLSFSRFSLRWRG